MTRVTNFGRKRTYLEAGFATDQTAASNKSPRLEANTADAALGDSIPPAKKSRTKRLEVGNEKMTSDPEGRGDKGTKGKKRSSFAAKKNGAKGPNISLAISGYKKRTEKRRLKRMTDRQAETVCFACREKGHAAKDCPGETGQNQKNTTIGLCYRCGLTNHTLSRCKKPEDPLNRFPFASCFICSGKGHLASACPQNKEKGIYPNGGSCKLCGQKTHLAKDCELRKKDVSGTVATTVFGTGGGAGADEDDFHTFKRKNAEVSKDEKQDRRRKRLDAKTGVQTGAVKTLDQNKMSSKPKKVVFF